MISVTRLLTDEINFGDSLRYNIKIASNNNYKPVVVWNMTKACNLNCMHCYSDSNKEFGEKEFTTEEAEKFIDTLIDFKVPVLLFSGGEPLLRQDLIHLIKYTVSKGIRAVISTNGTLISKEKAALLKESGVKYVGISLDGIGGNNDKFRGKNGAYEAALAGIRNCIEVGQKTGLRFTINKHNYKDIEMIFELIEKEKIPRVCFYHLAYSGRGSSMQNEDITDEEKRAVVKLIMDKTLDFHNRGIKVEILTVDNHADGVYIYNLVKEFDTKRGDKIIELLKINGGNRSGIAIGNVDWNGDVHPDQFSQDITLGNIRERTFGDIWSDTSNPVMAGFKNRKPLLEGRCGDCRWLDICNGNFRARAAANGNLWGEDPACYLTNEEIGITKRGE